MPDNDQSNPRFDSEFSRRALRHAPTPLLVLDRESKVRYANLAMLELGGWDEIPNRPALDFIHPEDHAELAASFETIVDSPSARLFGRQVWPEVRARFLTASGTIIHAEISAAGGILDDVVGGIIYSVRPAQTQHLMSRVLDELSQGAPIHQMLSHVCEMIAVPPLGLDAVIVLLSPDGSTAVAATTSQPLADAFKAPLDEFWKDTPTTPCRVLTNDIPATISPDLTRLGYNAFWLVRVESPLTPTTLRVFVASPTRPDPDLGVIDRIKRAREIASAVLLRTQTDVLLEYAAAHDQLTDLPNRAAFYRSTDALDLQSKRAALHLDLDGMSLVNENLGQATGDAILQIVADRLRSARRGPGLIGRIDGDEFSIVLAETEREPQIDQRALKLADRIREALSEPIVIAGRALTMSTSIGIAFAEPGVSPGQLLAWADTALHDAKSRGGDCVVRFGAAADG